ncbi:hypothetical protein ACFQGX_19760 [Nonomuraea dietziae]|uniref:WXG100 family type VII secretion target n=1 Tax=Nonomuraea dietziae TaxID=65515 RepID=UPI00362074C6
MAESIKKTHWLKPSRGEWTVDHDDRSVEEVKGLITGIRVKEIEDAGAAYIDAYAVVDDVQWALGQEAQALAKVWEGKASVAAQKALRTLYLALGELARKLLEMGHPLVTLADVVRQHQAYLDGDLRGAMKDDQRLNPWTEEDWLGAYVIFDGVLQSGKDSLAPAFGTSRDEMAGRHLETFSKDLEAIYDRLPDRVEKELPALAHPVEPLAERKMLDVPFGRPPFPGISSTSASEAGLPPPASRVAELPVRVRPCPASRMTNAPTFLVIRTAGAVRIPVESPASPRPAPTQACRPPTPALAPRSRTVTPLRPATPPAARSIRRTVRTVLHVPSAGPPPRLPSSRTSSVPSTRTAPRSTRPRRARSRPR